MGSQRLFIGTPIPTKTARKIPDLWVPDATDAVRWVKPENLHVTLQFLGETDDTMVPEILSVLAGLPCPDTVPLSLTGAGAFPSPRRARVLWIGSTPVKPGDPELADVRELLARGLRPLQIELGATFTPHVTVAYTRKNAKPERIRAVTDEFIDRMRPIRLDCTVPSIALFSSSLTPHGAIYRILYSR